MAERTCVASDCDASIDHLASAAKYCSRRCCNRVYARRRQTKLPGRRAECRQCGDAWYYASRGGGVKALCPACSETSKWCYRCKRARPKSDWVRDRTTMDGLNSLCRACQAGVDEPRPRRENHGPLWAPYRLTPQQHANLVRQQNGKCAICARADRGLVVDHCHRTGHVRGLLCSRCNVGLGFFRDNPELTLKATAYLDGW